MPRIDAMAAQSARRWHQFSLKALLVLIAVSSVPPGVYVGYRSHQEAKRRAQIEASYRWLESLAYPEMPNDRPIRITTRSWHDDEGAAEADSSVTVGYLLSEDSTSFTVLTPALRSVTYQRASRDEWIKSDSDFERTDLPTIARKALDQAKSQVRDPFDRFGYDLSERGELFILAWTCWRHGHAGLAIQLYEAAEASLEGNDNPEEPFLARLAADFAYMETWRATLACETQLPRRVLLNKFRWLQQHFPDSKYAPDVAKKVAILEAMVAEDDLQAKERESGLPFEQLSQSEQIADLIFQLRDQNGVQWSQPGSCDVLWTPDGQENSAGHQLLAYGYDAIPQLAAALNDQRLTRSVGFHRNFYFSHTVLNVGDAAEQILLRIAGRRFDAAETYEDESARIADMQKNALAWHAELIAKGERTCLIEAVEQGDETSASLAERLLEKHPDEACSAILIAIHKTDDDYRRNRFIEMLGRVHSDESVPFLLAELQHEKVWIRVTAAQALTDFGRPEGIDAMLHQWRSSQQIPELDGIGPFLAKCGRQEAIEAVSRRFSEQSIHERLETMDSVRQRHSPEELAAKPELRRAVIELLLSALNDTDVRTGMSGIYGNKSFSDPRVCDLAGYHLNCLDAAAFPFGLEAPLSQREVTRLAILKSRHDR